MASPASQTSLTNKTLALLGTLTRISAPDDGTAAAITAAALWDLTRDEVLADHPWNFAIRTDTVPQSADYVPTTRYLFGYELPRDCLRWLPWSDESENAFAAEQEGEFLVSNDAGPLLVRMVFRAEDVSRWSPGFQAAFCAKLGRYMAKPITGQGAMIDRMDGLYEQELSRAKRQDGLATGRRNRSVVYRSNWLGARTRGYGA